METINPSQMPPIQMQTGNPKKSVGSLIAVIIILALIIVGGLYFLKERTLRENYVPPVDQINEQADSITESLNQQSTTDDLESIEADLNSTDLDNLDQGAAAIETEL